jgi:hypothetical protein
VRGDLPCVPAMSSAAAAQTHTVQPLCSVATRRLGQLVSTLHSAATAPAAAAPVAAAAASVLSCLDYAYSFITGGGPDNAIRFWVESKTTLYDDVNGTVQVFYQCASCKSEDTFGRGLARSGKLLFQDPNYDFCPVYSTPAVPVGSGDPTDLSGGELIIYRRRLGDTSEYRQVLAYDDAIAIAFGVPTLRPYEAKAVYEVAQDDFDAVAEATRNCVPMVQQTELQGSDGLRAVIECPIKTMNIAEASSTPDHHPARMWQVRDDILHPSIID